MSTPKELDFFIEERNWPRGLEWYESHWPAETMIRGEASPNYTSFPLRQRVADKMARIVPQAKLIYLVRDPIARLVSHYMHLDAKRLVDCDFRTAVLRPGSMYVDRSRYMLQLEQFLDHYPRSRILVMDSAKLRSKRAAALRQVFRFLGVDERFTSGQLALEKHKTSDKHRISPLGAWMKRKLPWRLSRRLEPLLPDSGQLERPQLDDDLRNRLIALLKTDTDRFRAFTGRAFSDWQV